MSAKTTILMVLFFAGLIGLWALDRLGVPTAEQARRNSGRILPELIDVPAEEVARVQVANRSGEVTLERDGPSWWLTSPTSPSRALADRARVEALIDALKNLPRSPDAGTLEGPDASFGLTNGSGVRLFRAGQSSPLAALQVGSIVGDRRYVRPVPRSGVEIVDNNVLGSVDGTVADWREKNLFPVPSFDVVQVEARGLKGILEFDRRDGHHRIVRPFHAPADAAKLEQFFAALCSLRVADGGRGFLPDPFGDGKKFGLDHPSRYVRVRIQGQEEPREVQFGKLVPGDPNRVYARRVGEDQVFLVDTPALAALDGDPPTFRSLKVADVVADRITRLRIRGGGLVHELARDRGGWRIVAPEGSAGPADTQAVAVLIQQLAATTASEALDPSQKPPSDTGLDPPTMVIEAWEGSEAPVAGVALGVRDLGRKVLYARSGDDPAVLLLPTNVFDFGPAGPLAFRDRTILAQPPKRMTRLAARGKEGEPVELVARGEPGDFARWKMIAPVDAPADRDALAAIDFTLSQLRAETIVAELTGGSARFGLDDPIFVLTWATLPEAGGTAVEKTLRIGGEAAGIRGARYASLTGFPWIFALGARQVAILGSELHDRLVNSLKPDEVASVRLAWPDRALDLARGPIAVGKGSRWDIASGSPSFADEPARMDSLLTSLIQLRTPRFIQYRGPFRPEFGLSSPALGLEIYFRGSPRVNRLRLGAARSDNFRYATTDAGDQGAVFLLANLSAEPWASFLAIKKETPRLPELPANPFAKE